MILKNSVLKVVGALVVATSWALPSPAASEASVFQLSLKPSAYSRLCSDRSKQSWTLPRFRAFNSDGLLSWQLEGYVGSFYRNLKTKVRKGEAAKESWSLEEELAGFVAEDGSPVLANRLPAADVTLVQYGASWCAPCKPQMKDVRRFLEKNPELLANVLLVEADAGALPEVERPVKDCD